MYKLLTKKLLLSLVALSLILSVCSCGERTTPSGSASDANGNSTSGATEDADAIANTTSSDPTTVPAPESKSVLISFAGDCTIGSDTNFSYENSFHEVYEEKGYSHFFQGVKSIFDNDDYTVVNLEGTFTEATKKNVKKFNFKGPKKYADILTYGDVEAVNLANNHTYDYLETGYTDTKDALDAVQIKYFDADNLHIENIDGINFGFVGFSVRNTEKEMVLSALESLKSQGSDVIIVSYHWGVEREYSHNSKQEDFAKYAIDNGADLVIGHHPHVLQGIETYKGKHIVYSLGNFVFGGNRNPADKDSMVYQEEFLFLDNKLQETKANVIPVSISSVKSKNDFQPVILSGDERERVLKKIQKDSVNFECI